MVNPTRSEKPRKTSRTRGVSGEAANLKAYYKDNDVVLNHLETMLSDIYDNNSSYGKTDFSYDIITLRKRFLHEGLSFATKTLPNFFECTLRFIEEGISDYPGFKIKRGRTYPVFLQRLVAPIHEAPNDENTVICIKQLYQLCAAFKKLEGPYKQSVLDKQLVDFVETDIELRYLEWDAEPNWPILRHARKLIGLVIKGLNPFDPDQANEFLPKPGPGATNTPTKANVRFCPHTRYTALDSCFPLEEWYSIPKRYGDDMDHENETHIDYFLRYYGRTTVDKNKRFGYSHLKGLPIVDKPTSRLKFVPKTFSKARGICIEQLETQWLQQAVKTALYHRIEQHPLTRGLVNFTDQNVNGALAQEASFDRLNATIDMSAASDRISRKLVSYLFADNSEMLDALLALSTEEIELPKEDRINFINLFPTAKYAPMGSALCFPIMSLVHFALIQGIILFSSVPCKYDSVHVYGDDIIIPSKCVQAVYDWLPRFGMKLNVEKSFYRSGFRESCGTHAYNGHVITPTRFKSVITSKPCFPGLLSNLKYETDLYYKGFVRTAKLIRTLIQKVYKGANNWPVVTPKSPVLGWIREFGDASLPEVTPHKKRWMKGTSLMDGRRQPFDYQCFEYRVKVLIPISEKLPPLDEEQGYLRKLVTHVLDKPRHTDGTCDRFKIEHRWVSEPLLRQR